MGFRFLFHKASKLDKVISKATSSKIAWFCEIIILIILTLTIDCLCLLLSLELAYLILVVPIVLFLYVPQLCLMFDTEHIFSAIPPYGILISAYQATVISISHSLYTYPDSWTCIILNLVQW